MKDVERAQRSEITEYYIYRVLSAKAKGENARTLEGIAKDELRHYNILKGTTGKEFSPDWVKVRLYSFLAEVLGLTFVLKFMERGENSALNLYGKIKDRYPQIADIMKDEEEHEMKLLNILSEEKIKYASAIVLGLNDALVELTGSIAGLSLALGETKTVGIAGLIIGIAASLSMAASSYLSSKENEDENPGKAALYTGVAYILTVVLLVLPYFILTNVLMALGITLVEVLLIIASYSYYMSVVKDERFMAKFGEMATISLGVALISFLIGGLLRGLGV